MPFSSYGQTLPRLPVGSPEEPPLKGALVTGVRAGQAPTSHPDTDTPAFTQSHDLARGRGVWCSADSQLSSHLGAEAVVAPTLPGYPGLGSVGNRCCLPSLKGASWTPH